MRSALAFVAALGIAGCGKVEATSSSGVGGAWRATSAKIEISSFGFWEGSSGYAKSRGEMTPEQLKALDGLKIIPTPQNGHTADNTSYRVLITDADGTVAEYRAAFGNYVDGDEGQGALQKRTLDFASLRPFLSTFDCKAAKDVHYELRHTSEPGDPKTANLSRATKLPTDLGCQNAIYVPAGCSDSFLQLELAAGGTYELSDSYCFEQMSLRLYSIDGGTKLAESTPSAGKTCFTMRYAFEPGTYLLHFIKTNVGGCEEGKRGDGGDTSLSITRLP